MTGGSQLKQSIRLANVPQADFERQVKSEKPPTVTALADSRQPSRYAVTKRDNVDRGE
jgi:hypothetical protein